MGHALDFVGDIFGGGGGALGFLSPITAPLALVGLGQSEQNKAEKKAQQRALATWQTTSLPNQAAVKASAIENRGALGQARLGAYQNLMSQMAARGFGSGSGLMKRGGAGIESSYLQALGKQATDLMKYANTPMWGPPSSVYPTPQISPLGATANYGADLFSTALGYFMGMQMLGGLGGGQRIPRMGGGIGGKE